MMRPPYGPDKRVPLHARPAEEMAVAGIPEDAAGLDARMRREEHAAFGGVSVRDGRLLITLRLPPVDGLTARVAQDAPEPPRRPLGRPAAPDGPDDRLALLARLQGAQEAREALGPHLRSGRPGEPPGGAERRAAGD